MFAFPDPLDCHQADRLQRSMIECSSVSFHGRFDQPIGIPFLLCRLNLRLLSKTLANWMRAANAGQLSEAGKHQPAASEAELGLARVKRELAEVKMERDLLTLLCQVTHADVSLSGHRN
jgi:hypothetical protein